MNLIISQIIGGIGNQMFQYAAARALSLERGQSLRLDISGFSGYGLHQGFELQRVFNCPLEVATESEVRGVLHWQNSSVIRRLVSRPGMSIFRRDGFVIEPHFNYWSGINTIPAHSYLVGYWQSEKYFNKHVSVISSDFTFKKPLINRNAEVADKISRVNAVSLHVRRGDYVNNLKTNAVHGVCSTDYYRVAAKYIADRVENPFFVLFSDDMNWVRKNIEIDFPCLYVDHNEGVESYNDMHLMSLCRHNIIANSSFSWWGAWLNSNFEKIVVAPKRWFLKATVTSDLIPDEWTAL